MCSCLLCTAPAVIFARTSTKQLFTSIATANQYPGALIHTQSEINVIQNDLSPFLKELLCL